MKYFARILILAIFSVVGVFFVSYRLPSPLEDRKAFLFSFLSVGVEEGTQTKNSETAVKVLKESCGSCHRSTIPTGKPKALAIFDLDDKPWYESVADNHLKGISRRIGKKSGISEPERKATLEFIACIRRMKADNSQSGC